MNTLSIPVVIIASISLYVGLYHLLLYFRRRQKREDLTFAFLCFANVLYDAFCIGLYNAASTSAGAQWQRAQFISLAVFAMTFLLFVSDYTGQKPGMVTYGFWIFYLLAIIVQLVDRSNLTFRVDEPSIKHIVILYTQPITYYEVTLGIFTTIQGVAGLFVSAHILNMGIRYYKRGFKREAIPLIAAIVCMYAASLHDTLVGWDVYRFIYLIEYSYLAVILLMAYSLSNTVVEAAIAKEELKRSEERLRSLVETTSDWVWEVDTNGAYTYASPKVRDLLGYEPKEIIGRTAFDLMPADKREQIRAVFQDHVLHQRPIERLENVVCCQDGKLVVLETSGVPFFDGNGNLSGYRGIDRDITGRKQAERALRESEERLRQIASALRETIWLRDAQTRQVLYVNPAFEELTGWTCQDFYDNPNIMRNAIHPDDRERVDKALDQRLEDGYFNEEHRIIRRDGSVRWVTGRTFPVRNEAGEIYRWASIMEDITARRQAETEREALIANLEATNAELERFTYTVSHDLKSPLVTIMGFLGFLEKDALAGNMDKVRLDSRRITQSVEKMRLLLQELLELSRIGRLANPAEAVLFEDVVRDALAAVQGRLDACGVSVEIQSNLPVVYGDRQRLIEVVQNLVDNAAKFMGAQPEPRVEIGQRGEEQGKPVLYVKDNGIGIAAPHQERIFGLFNKLDASTEGTGIGLAIVKRIIEVSGGRIWVESEAGNGCTFCFTLPIG